ncbi:MAG: saccharopine dehydrogenase NADP-binding domain-containing protein [Pseudomonadales bacterium]|nr:saccharopine dehydrogenase NADP-binding domain-containing protein [Pseudomonadales bacterium]
MTNPRKVAILGAGKIGGAIAKLLHHSGDYAVTVYDQHSDALQLLEKQVQVNTQVFAITDVDTLVSTLSPFDAVVSACSYDVNVLIAEAALKAGISYFDLTEDVATTEVIRTLSTSARDGQIFMPQCGLAPGFIGILAASLSQQFEKLDTIKMRVGALPKYPSNRMMYNLTWSTDGLINEYCNLCDAIEDGHRIKLMALEGLECFSLDGLEYEAFNTSGGLGTLCESLEGKVRELNYKTVRYKGHQYLMQFLIQELQLGKNDRRAILKQILETSIPMTKQDVVLTFVTVKGWRDGMLEQITDARKIYYTPLYGEDWSSIQLSTSASLCAVVDLFFEKQLPQKGFVKQEQVDLNLFLANRFGQYYQTNEPTLNP